MAEAGILRDDERIELIEGRIFKMAPIGARHGGVVSRLSRLLARQLPEGLLAWVQATIRLAPDAAPEPDLAVVHDRAYGDVLPGPEDIRLIIEVAETSLRFDRNVKLPLYAAAGIPEVWVVI